MGGCAVVLPLRTHAWVHALLLACLFSSYPQRCALDCRAPAARAFYTSASRRLSEAAARLMPLAVASRHSRRLRWGPGFDCLLVRAWAQTVLGYLAPTLLVDFKAELAAAVAWRRQHGFAPRELALAGRVLRCLAGLLAVASVVSFVGAELALTVLHRWAGILGLAGLAGLGGASAPA